MGQGPDYALAKHLSNRGFGVFFDDVLDAGGDPLDSAYIFAGKLTPRPESAIFVLLGIGGSFPTRVSEEHILEILVRDPDYETAQETALNISNMLHQTEGDIGGILMRLIFSTPPASLGEDEGKNGGRWVFAQPVRAQMKLGENQI